ncbi:type VII secretion target [Saccharopolyspora sp. NPDC049357]|uniref:type VII secretion target n=1 Tax=Saccharopolyspora sp. NPDC049357 TaxID=3154507 RepID=UPI003432E8C5
MGDGFKVNPEELRSFAKGLDERGGQVDEAAQATGEIKLGYEAFGPLVVILSQFVDNASDEFSQKLKECSASIDKAVDDINAAAADYERDDERSGQNIDQVKGAM